MILLRPSIRSTDHGDLYDDVSIVDNDADAVAVGAGGQRCPLLNDEDIDVRVLPFYNGLCHIPPYAKELRPDVLFTFKITD